MTGSGPPERWTARRRQIVALLGDRDADAAQLYRTAIDGLAGSLTHASLMVTGHCIRELIKVLPVILGYPIIERADASRSVRELYRQWAESELPLASDDLSEAQVISVPVCVFAAAREAANAGAKGNNNSRKLTAMIVTGQTGDADIASVKRVHTSIELFREWAHARDYTKPLGPVPAIARVLQELEIIEEALLNRLDNMADRAKTVRELLAIANRKLDEEEL
jgi:hypothetical protein